MNAEHEIVREARGVLRKLIPRGHLAPVGDGRFAVVARGGARMRVAAALVSAMCAKGWLRQENGVVIATESGRSWFAHGDGDPFAAQHRLLRTRLIKDNRGRERYVVVNAAESPIAWLHERGLIGEVEFEAGERLRRDFTMAQLTPRMGVDLTAPLASGRRAPKAEAHLTDTILAAKQRFTRALRAAGPGLSDVLFDVCCHLHGLEHCEQARDWPRASARIVLRIALERLAAHYGTIVHARRRTRAWRMEEEQPDA